jgi:starch synthase
MDRSVARAELGIPQDARVAVWHGRVLLYRKGLDLLLHAWESVCRERPGKDLRLILLGTGNDSDEFRARLDAMRLQGVLWIDRFFVDPTAIKCYLSAANVYVFPSRHEGFPVAPIEAMAASLPVVAADAPGVSDIFENGEDAGGLIVPVDNAAAFAQALGRMLDDVAWSRDLGQRAYRRAQTSFSLEAIGAQLSSFMTGRESQQMVHDDDCHALSDVSTRRHP